MGETERRGNKEVSRMTELEKGLERLKNIREIKCRMGWCKWCLDSHKCDNIREDNPKKERCQKDE